MGDGKVIRLVPAARLQQQAETVAELERLLEEARQGRLVGFLGACMFYPAGVSAMIVGAAKEHPTYCRGMLANLDDQLALAVSITPIRV